MQLEEAHMWQQRLSTAKTKIYLKMCLSIIFNHVYTLLTRQKYIYIYINHLIITYAMYTTLSSVEHRFKNLTHGY